MPQIQFIQQQDRAPEYLQTGLSALARANELNLARAKQLYDMSHSLSPEMQLAVRNKAYEMAGHSGYADAFNKLRPKESDGDVVKRIRGDGLAGLQNAGESGLPGTPGYKDAMQSSVATVIEALENAAKNNAQMTREQYMAGMQNVDGGLAGAADRFNRKASDIAALEDSAEDMAPITPEAYAAGLGNAAAPNVPVSQGAQGASGGGQQNVVSQSTAFRGNPLTRAGGDGGPNPEAVRSILDHVTHAYQYPQMQYQRAMNIAREAGMSGADLQDIDSYFQGAHMQEHGVTRPQVYEQESQRNGRGSSVPGPVGDGRTGYALIADEAGGKGKSTMFRAFGKDTAENSLASAISAIEPGADADVIAKAQMRLRKAGLDVGDPMAGYSERDIAVVEGNLRKLLNKYDSKMFGFKRGTVSGTGEINLENLPDKEKPMAAQLIARLHRLKTQQLIKTGKEMQDSRYDERTHKKIEEAFAKGGTIEGREVKTTSRIPEFTLKIGKGDKIGSASLDVLAEWAPASDQIQRIAAKSGGQSSVMPAGVAPKNRRPEVRIEANNVANDLAQ